MARPQAAAASDNFFPPDLIVFSLDDLHSVPKIMARPKPLVLIILDGWGYRAETHANAIALARKPTYDRLLLEYPNILIHTSGPFVGLPEGQMGNSEVGHLNIGAGRIVHMDITRIDLMIRTGNCFPNPSCLMR